MRALPVVEHPARLVAFVRDPIERCVSGYRFFHRIAKDWASSWEAWVDRVLSTDNPHWSPQSSLVGDADCYRFECLNEVWETLGFAPLTRANVSHYAATNDYRCDELRAFYRPDFELRARCHSTAA